MLLNERESGVAVAALQALDRELALEIESFAEPTATGAPESLRVALGRHEQVANLARKLATCGEHEIDVQEAELAREGLDLYVDLLSDSIEEHEIETDDFLLSPERQSRQSALMQTGRLLDRLDAGR